MEEEFDEEEIWAMVRETKDDSLKTRKLKDGSFFSSMKASSASRYSKVINFFSYNIKTNHRKIPRSNNTVGEDNSSSTALIRQSAPVTIPNWSKIFKRSETEDEEEDEEEDRVPPHEWIAKKLERNQISSFSVCEGEGRTLKGRDQRKVRNAVLTRTGFLE
ncbi:hypothetical protein MA16_Dca005408 [Dendrobium catenatum]|uniref:Senescence regulator S40 n=1 Tax=Dendrobium catenatum TaxID=906689 RepID=A0A2I0X3B8_9ASPA|nr:hypothetical protein MA16_Dca005408 [Dendrobium catenatum]